MCALSAKEIGFLENHFIESMTENWRHFRFSPWTLLWLVLSSQLITGAQPKAGTGHKMQSISVVFSTLHCEGYIPDLRYCWLITSGSARWLIETFIRHFEKHETWRTVNRKMCSFWGNDTFPSLYDAQVYERNYE